ncbi:hypothetical protein AB0D57_41495 [Streptomyces sp. NPDC048275]|uniref:hypothetical protein n=1 Tax=Streptomyces sp. NPDC048275 TaxID=3155629 RepID=UPI0033E1BC45
MRAGSNQLPSDPQRGLDVWSTAHGWVAHVQVVSSGSADDMGKAAAAIEEAWDGTPTGRRIGRFMPDRRHLHSFC